MFFFFAEPHGHIYLCTFFLLLLLLSTTGIPISYFWQIQVPYTILWFQIFRLVQWAA